MFLPCFSHAKACLIEPLQDRRRATGRQRRCGQALAEVVSKPRQASQDREACSRTTVELRSTQAADISKTPACHGLPPSSNRDIIPGAFRQRWRGMDAQIDGASCRNLRPRVESGHQRPVWKESRRFMRTSPRSTKSRSYPVSPGLGHRWSWGTGPMVMLTSVMAVGRRRAKLPVSIVEREMCPVVQFADSGPKQHR